MQSLIHDSELMTQHVAAIAVPNSTNFVTVNDENGNIMIFSLGTDKKFHVIKKDSTGNFVVNDLGALLRLTNDYKGYAFAVAQTSDNTIYIVLASESASHPASNGLSVLKGFLPERFDLTLPSTDLRELIIPSQSDQSGKHICSLFINNSDKRQDYPLVVASYQPLDHVNHTEDLARVAVDPGSTGWSLATDLQLPENAFTMRALQPLNLPWSGGKSLPGFAALYEIQEELQLIFMSSKPLQGDSYYQVSLTPPKGARSLSSSVNPDGYTDLLVGGSGLYRYTAQEVRVKGSAGTLVTDSGVFSAIRELYVSQFESALSCWAAGMQDGVGYVVADNTWASPKDPVPVIPDGQGGNFAPFSSRDGGASQLVVADVHGALTVLQNDAASGIWKRVPLYTPNLDKTVDIPSYTTQITVTGDNKLPLINSEVSLRSSGLVSIIVNGKPVETDTAGTTVTTDQYGMLTLIIPTNDISSHIFSVSLVGANAAPVSVDPAQKVNDALAKIQTGEDLKNATLQDGTKLLDGKNLSDSDIDKAAKAIAAAQKARKTVDQDGTKSAVMSFASHETGMFGQHVEVFHAASSNGVTDMLWDAWHWFENLVEGIESWAVNLLEKGAEFLVTIAGKAYRWVLDGLTEIGKAISWIFEKVLEIAEKVIRWLGFLFNWGDIQATHRSIVHLMNSALDCGVGMIDTLEVKVAGFFDDLHQQIQKIGDIDRPEEVNSAAAGGDSVTEEDQKSNPVASTKVNWAQYQLTHGGAASSSVIHDSTGGEGGVFDTFWDDVVKPLFDLFETLAGDIGNMILELFSQDSSITVEQAMAKMAVNTLLDFVDGVRNLAVGFLKVAAALVEDFKTSINYKVTIPVFSDLYRRFLSGGDDLTFLDGLALILAIPVTILTKIATNKAPADMTTINYDDLVKGNGSEADVLEFNKFGSVSGLFAVAMEGAIEGISTLVGSASAPSVAQVSSSVPALRGQTAIARVPRAAAMNLQVQTFKVGGAKEIGKKYWKDILAVAACIVGIPLDSKLPQYILRWVSWLLACINRAVAAALRRVTAAAEVLVEKALAVVEALLATINYALVVTIRVFEFTTSDYPGRNPAWSTIDTMSGSFDVVSTLSADIAHLAGDPETKTIAEGVSLACLLLSISLTGVKTVAKIPLGEYNDTVNKVF